MADQTLLLTADDPQWDDWVRRAPHDFYHLAAYHAFAEQMGEGEAFLVVFGNSGQFLAWPYLRCAIDDSQVDASSVYGYSGPVGLGLDDQDFLERAWEACQQVWAEQRLATLFTRFHPIIENYRFCENLHGVACPQGGEVLHLGRSISIDLALSRDERRRGYQKNLRQEIRASERAGLHVELDEHWQHYRRFAELYRQTMDKNQASDRYLFSDDYFDQLRLALAEQASLAVALMDEEPAAILLFTVCNGIAQAHLTGINPQFGRHSPLKLLIDGVAELAAAQGAQRLHLGAGRGGQEDSLFRFKNHFSSDEHAFRIGRWILDRDIHDSLAEKRYGSIAAAKGSFFPAYRAPAD